MKKGMFKIIYSGLLLCLSLNMQGQIEPEKILDFVESQIDTTTCEKRDTFFSFYYLWGWFDTPSDSFRIARCFEKKGMEDSVIVYLNKAIDEGLFYRDSSLIDKDTFILKYKTHIKIEKLRFMNRDYVEYDSLREELLSLREKDQQCRGYYSIVPTKEEWEGQKHIDSLNQLTLKEIVISIAGWPGRKEVGKEASSIARMIAVHADRNVSFQDWCLDLMFDELPKKNVNFRNFAMLYDRCLLAKTGEQLFGTQIEIQNEIYVPKKLALDINSINYLRDFFTMIPLSLSMKSVNDYYRKKKGTEKN